MKSICIKTVSKEKVNFLINEFEKLPLNIYISSYRFKVYDNVIVHSLTDDFEEFLDYSSEVIKKCIEFYYEDNFIINLIKKNYFYLFEEEQEYILKITKKVLKLPDEKIGNKNEILKENIKEYIRENKSIIIEGVVNFRIQEYKEILDKIVEISVVSYLNLISN